MLVSALVLSLALAARHPDFSGRWMLTSASAGAETPIVLVVTPSVTRTNVRGEPVTPYYSGLKIDRHFPDRVRTAVHSIGILGGTVGSDPREPRDAPRTSTRQSVTWEGSSLVFRYRTYIDREWVTQSFTEHEDRWSLDASDRLVIATTTRASNEPTATSIAAYIRVR